MAALKDRRTLRDWRGKLLDFFHDQMRGIKQVKILADTGLTPTMRNQLSLLMAQSKTTVKKRMPAVKMSFSQVLATLRAERVENERLQNHKLAKRSEHVVRL